MEQKKFELSVVWDRTEQNAGSKFSKHFNIILPFNILLKDFNI